MPSVPPAILDLVERFDRNRAAYRAGQYNEAQLRIEFLDPFFEALGWDMYNKHGYSEAYKDVIHEDSIKVGDATKAPDYCFKIGKERKFFLEAKKPSVDIRGDVGAAFQLRRYAWSAKLPLSILSDFEEFAVYDCRIKPEKADKAGVARISFLTYQDYPTHWEEIAAVFSREAVLQGSFDRYAESNKAKKGTAEVDDAFLQEIESWRELLAHNLALRNPSLRPRELNFAVQSTIDRIIFLRICEDRGIETYGQLQALLNGANTYARLGEMFARADQRYNSGLFHFSAEKGRAEPPDEFTLGLAIDDKPLKEIIRRLYYPESPYEFSVLPADILGQVYEQFLGKVIRLTPAHRAVVEDKPEVKKAGGVFYTPTYIVEYIVQHTVGKLLAGKTPKQAAGLRILDPACGSGSFLIGAYQYLLDWYREWYSRNEPEKWARGRNPALYQAAGGEWRLTTAERKRILLDHLYGVDIDPQAVEVTKLSLLLKVLEAESATFAPQLMPERALPDLAANIKCGNSLIGPEFYTGWLPGAFTPEDVERVNAFDWAAEFPAVMAAGGFDCVIGNPPYVRIQTMKEWAPLEVEYYKAHYRAAGKGNYDLYVVFVEKGLSLLNEHGRLGFILPHKFFNAQYGEPLRRLIAEGRHLAEVVHFGDQQVFRGATTYTCLMFLDKAGSEGCRFVRVTDLIGWRDSTFAPETVIPASSISETEWVFGAGNGTNLLMRLAAAPCKLVDCTKIFQGIATSADSVYVLNVLEEGAQMCKMQSRSLDSDVLVETELLHPLLKGSEISRYREPSYQYMVLFPYRVEAGCAAPIPERELRAQFPAAHEYLTRNKTLLLQRSKTDTGNWWLYPYPKNLALYVRPKILSQVLSTRGNFALDYEGRFYFLGGGTAGGNAIVLDDDNVECLLYLLGILNSRLTTFHVSQVGSGFRGGFFAFGKGSLASFPIYGMNPTAEGDKPRHDRMVALVEQMLKLHQDLAAAKTAHDKTLLQRQIEATDRQIDHLVYELYGLTEEEIKIVEGS